MFSRHIRRWWTALALVPLAALGLALQMALSQPVVSGAEAIDSHNGHTAKLEALHQRAVARAKADEDDEDTRPAWGAGIPPERAAHLASQAHGKHHKIELKMRDGRPVYEVRLEHKTVYVDVETEEMKD